MASSHVTVTRKSSELWIHHDPVMVPADAGEHPPVAEQLEAHRHNPA
jgi:hypothetical protein